MSPEVRAVTIDELLQSGNGNIDILKLDIEGSEADLFASNDTSWIRRVKVFAIELHDRLRPGCSKSFYSALGKFDYHQEVRGENVFVKLIKES